MKKGILALGLVSTMVLSLSLNACGAAGENKGSGSDKTSQVSETSSKVETAIDIVKIADRLKDEIKYDDKLEEMPEESMDILYPQIAKDKVKNKKVYLSSSGGTAEEIACFEGTDEDAAKLIETGLNERIELQKASFSNYVPEEVKRLDKAFVIRKGACVFLSVSADPDKAKSIIEEK